MILSPKAERKLVTTSIKLVNSLSNDIKLEVTGSGLLKLRNHSIGIDKLLSCFSLPTVNIFKYVLYTTKKPFSANEKAALKTVFQHCDLTLRDISSAKIKSICR